MPKREFNSSFQWATIALSLSWSSQFTKKKLLTTKQNSYIFCPVATVQFHEYLLGFSHLPPPAPRPSSAGVVSLWLPSPAGVVCWCRNGLDHPNTTQLYTRTTHEEKLNYSLNCCFKQNRASRFQLIQNLKHVEASQVGGVFQAHFLTISLKFVETLRVRSVLTSCKCDPTETEAEQIHSHPGKSPHLNKKEEMEKTNNTIYPSTQVIHSRATALISHI